MYCGDTGIECFICVVLHAGQGRLSSHADTDSDSGHVMADTVSSSDNVLGHPVTVQQEFVYCTEPPAASPPRVIASQMPSGSGVRGPHITSQPRCAVRTTVLCSMTWHHILPSLFHCVLYSLLLSALAN